MRGGCKAQPPTQIDYLSATRKVSPSPASCQRRRGARPRLFRLHYGFPALSSSGATCSGEYRWHR